MRGRAVVWCVLVATVVAASWSTPLAASVPGSTIGSGGTEPGRVAADVGTTGPSAVGTPASAVDHGARFFGVSPTRMLDSRTALGGFGGALGPGVTRDLLVAGVAPVGGDAVAVVLNVTVTGATAASYLTVAPSGSSPTAASLVFAPGQTTSNLVTVGVGAGGKVGFFNQLGSVDVVADVVGWFGPSRTGGLFRSLSPTRVLDSRGEVGGWGSAPLGPGEVRGLAVAGVAGVPVIAEAAVLNVTVTGGTASSYLQVSPEGAGAGGTASVLFGAGQTTSNLVMVGLGPSGSVSVFNQLGDVDVVVDLVGWFDHSPGGAGFFPTEPVRLLDDRSGVGVSGPWTAGANRSVPLAGVGPVPVDASGVVANVTVTGGTAASFVSVGPSPGVVPPPNANVVFAPGQTVPNAVVSALGAGGAVDVFNQLGSVHVIADVAGWFGPPDNRRTKYDRDGDGKADWVVYRWGSPHAWLIYEFGGSWPMTMPTNITWSASGDYDGDGHWELSGVTADGDWVTEGRAAPVHFPMPTPWSRSPSVPVPGDYNGDGRTDPAWYDEATGTWYILGREPFVLGAGPTTLGASGLDGWDADSAVPGDFDGDGKDDPATYRSRTGLWTILRSSDGVVESFTFGDPATFEWPAVGDVDGVGHDQPVLFDFTNGYRILGHSEPLLYGGYVPSASRGDQPALADMDGDGRVELGYLDHVQGGGLDAWLFPTSLAGSGYGGVELTTADTPWIQSEAMRIDTARLTLVEQCFLYPDLGNC